MVTVPIYTSPHLYHPFIPPFIPFIEGNLAAGAQGYAFGVGTFGAIEGLVAGARGTSLYSFGTEGASMEGEASATLGVPKIPGLGVGIGAEGSLLSSYDDKILCVEADHGLVADIGGSANVGFLAHFGVQVGVVF